MSIETIKIRARIYIGNIVVATPYILSFNVTKTRNSKSTFSASIKVLSSNLSSIRDNKVVIYAGEKSREKKIFTGYILSSRPSICFDDPSYTILNISGSDILYRLEGEKYTRRQMDSKARWAIIESVTRAAEKGGQFALVNEIVQFTDQDVASNTEKKNKNNTNSSLDSMGVTNVTSMGMTLNFRFGAINLVEEAPK
jgi:hypothetical protein